MAMKCAVIPDARTASHPALNFPPKALSKSLINITISFCNEVHMLILEFRVCLDLLNSGYFSAAYDVIFD